MWQRSYWREREYVSHFLRRERRPQAHRDTKKRQKLRWGETTRFHAPPSDPLRRLYADSPVSLALLPSSRARAPPLEARLPARSFDAGHRRRGVLLHAQSPATGPPAPSTVSRSSSAGRQRRRAPAATAEAAANSGPDGEERKDGLRTASSGTAACARRPQSHLPAVAELAYFQIRCHRPRTPPRCRRVFSDQIRHNTHALLHDIVGPASAASSGIRKFRYVLVQEYVEEKESSCKFRNTLKRSKQVQVGTEDPETGENMIGQIFM